MKYLYPFVLLLLSAIGTAAVHAGVNKVQICHIPPDDPDNFHTITVSEKALPAHLAHGDLAGSCFSFAEELCDDGNACTIDAFDEQTETCITEHPAVDCNDGNSCTVDSCDPVAGCQYAPTVCDDGNLCTVDACDVSTGGCLAVPIDCGLFSICEPQTGICTDPCDGVTCDPIDQCHVAGQCSPDIAGAPYCSVGDLLPEGTSCDDGNDGTINDACDINGDCVGESVEASIVEDYEVLLLTDTEFAAIITLKAIADGAISHVNLEDTDGVVLQQQEVIQNPQGYAFYDLEPDTSYVIRIVAELTDGTTVEETIGFRTLTSP